MLTEGHFKVLTSTSRHQFEELFNACQLLAEGGGTKRRIKEKHLFIFLFKLRHYVFDNFLQIIFNYNCLQMISKITRILQVKLSLL